MENQYRQYGLELFIILSHFFQYFPAVLPSSLTITYNHIIKSTQPEPELVAENGWMD